MTRKYTNTNLKEQFSLFRDLSLSALLSPYVTIRCSKTNTRFYAHDGDGSQIEYLVPVSLGFINAQKKTNVAAQVTAASLGQKLRNRQGILIYFFHIKSVV